MPTPPSSHRFVADENTAAALSRSYVLSCVRRPFLWVFLVGFAMVQGVAFSLVVNAHAIGRYPGRTVVVGVVWGLEIALFVCAVLCVALFLLYVVNRRMFARQFPAGTELEAVLTADALVVREPSGSRSIGYASIRKVRADPLFVRVYQRGRPQPTFLPRSLLPEEDLRLLRQRAGAPSGDLTGDLSDSLSGSHPAETSTVHQFRVPADWASHVAAALTGFVLRDRRFYERVLLSLLVGAAFAVGGASQWWLLLPLAYGGLSVAFTYIQTRRVVGFALPTGALVTAEFGDDRLVYRRPAFVDEIRYGDCTSVHLLGDVVGLRLKTMRSILLMPLQLFPADRLAALSTAAHTARAPKH